MQHQAPFLHLYAIQKQVMMNKKLIAIALLCLVCLAAEAESRKEKSKYELRRHEVSLSVAGVPTRHFMDIYNYTFITEHGLRYGQSVANTYFEAATYEIEKVIPVISANYFYNTGLRSAFGASFSYEGGSDAFYRRSDGSLIGKENKNIITLMAYYRLSWLNRPWIRMYSLIGMGTSFSLEGYQEDEGGFALQFSPLCISVGQDIYGFAETGIGTGYFGVNIGIGYRF